MESEAILTIIDYCERGIWDLCSTDALHDEIDRMDDLVKKQKVLTLYDYAIIDTEMNISIIDRASALMQQANVTPFDALHIASAEARRASVFLTTDRKLISASKRVKTFVRVLNPAIWLTEVLFGDY